MAKKQTLESVLEQKIREPRIIYLLGGGASFCAGLPGIFKLTSLVRSKLRNAHRSIFNEIMQSLVENGVQAPNMEEVLSELYYRLGGARSTGHDRQRFQETFYEICRCIQKCLEVDSSTEYHKEFVRRLVNRRKAEPAEKAPPVQIFTTNYDLLIELACDESCIVAINGFEGIFRRRWNLNCFDCDIGKATTHVQTPRFEPSARHIRLYKLHGSLSWFEDNGKFCEEKLSSGSKNNPLIIYPSRLKYAQSIHPPFDHLFLRFNAAVSEAKLLISIGYRFADDHLNQYIFTGLDNGLSLLAFSKEPIDALNSKSGHSRVSVINEEGSIIEGVAQSEVTDLWAFEKFAKWLPALKEK